MNSNSGRRRRNTRVLLTITPMQRTISIHPIEMIENRMAKIQGEIPYIEFLEIVSELRGVLNS